MLEKLKSYQYHLFLAVFIGLISFISFNLGKVVSDQKGELKVTQGANIYSASQDQDQDQGTSYTIQDTSPKPTPKPLDMRVVVSKNSDKYHYSWCSSWKRIKPENQVWFNTEQDAIDAGYTLAGNCNK